MHTAALIELGGSHDECLYAQIKYLKESGYTVHLICISNLKQQVSGFDNVDQFLFFDFSAAGAILSIRYLLQIRNHLIKNKISKVVFNTAEGNLVRNLTLLPFPSQISFSGIIHNARKLLKSSSQRIISRRIKKYFVLNDYILPHVSEIKYITTASFYPIFLPEFKAVNLPKEEGDLWVCIPGQVDFKRRDYISLLEALKKHKPIPGLRFIILGRDLDPEKRFLKMVEEAGLKEHFILSDSFITNDVFHSYLAQSDVILPLVHPGLPKFEQYLKYKITGSFNLAFAYKKPLLSEEHFKSIPDLQENALFYSVAGFGETLNKLPDLLPQLNTQLYQDPKWEFNYQRQKFLSFIENASAKA